MSTDRELIEAAARAAGKTLVWDAYIGDGETGGYYDSATSVEWNPLTDSTDALELAVKVGMLIDARYTDPAAQRFNDVTYWPTPSHGERISVGEGEPLAAIRRAITRAAAAIGATPTQQDPKAAQGEKS